MSDDRQVSRQENQNPEHDVSRREAIKTALKVGVYVAPVVLAAGVPPRVAAQASGPTGTLAGNITDAISGLPIAGALVQVGAASGTTNATGDYTIPNAPAGAQTATTSASGYTTRNDPVNVIAASTTTFNTALVPTSSSGDINIVLTWGALPTDLDSHLVGPDGGGGAGRFHCYYGDPTPVAFVTLDIDDTTSFGPETISVSPNPTNFVPGSYSYFVHNYSGSPGFDSSSAVVTVFQGGSQIAQYLVGAASGDPASSYWSVFGFTLTATPTGGIVITPVQAFTNTAPTLAAFVPPPKR